MGRSVLPLIYDEAKKAKKGDGIGVKVSEKVRKGYKVYKVK